MSENDKIKGYGDENDVFQFYSVSEKRHGMVTE
jgi:hypothetical protein